MTYRARRQAGQRRSIIRENAIEIEQPDARHAALFQRREPERDEVADLRRAQSREIGSGLSTRVRAADLKKVIPFDVTCTVRAAPPDRGRHYRFRMLLEIGSDWIERTATRVGGR